MKRYDKNAKYRIVCYAVTAIAVLVGWFLRGPAASALIPMLSVFVPHEQVTTMANTCRANGTTLYLVVVLMVLVWLIIWAVQHQLFKRGLRYALVHARMVHELQKGLLETPGYSVELNNQEAKLPAIKIEFSRNMINGLIKIQNHIKYNTLLEKVNLSPAIGRYVVEQQYLTDDENWYVFEITDGLIDWRLIFDNYSHFQTYCKRQEDYTIFIDKRTSLPLCSMLLVGETGSGKTYTLYSMILQFLNWRMVPELYFVDPKDSSLAVISDRIAPDRSAADIEEIIALLERFHDKMQERKRLLKEKLPEKLDADYRRWNMRPHVLIFDELAAFQGVVNTLDKATRDKVAMFLRDIVLQGRQLGFFLWAVMQKSDSKDIPTAIRDNLPWKVVLGLASNTTYMTAFEHSADLPKRNFEPGEGLYTYSGKTRGPKVISFPTLDFDILSAILEAADDALAE